MPKTKTTKKNSAIKKTKKTKKIVKKKRAVYPKIVCKSPWSVTEVTVLDDYILKVKFYDGVEGFVYMKERALNCAKDSVFSVLKDPNFFKKAYIYLGAVTWPGELDLASDAMHDEIKKHGKWVLK